MSRYLKALVPLASALITAAGIVMADWQPDGRVVGATWRLALGALLSGAATGYGVAVVPNAPPIAGRKRPSVHPTLVDPEGWMTAALVPNSGIRNPDPGRAHRAGEQTCDTMGMTPTTEVPQLETH